MASLRNDGGRWILQFTTPDKRRKTIRLGKLSKRDAESVKSRVEDLVSNGFAGRSTSDDTARWLRDLPDGLYGKLVSAGLADARVQATLEAFIQQYTDGRNDLKPATKIVRGQVKRNLVKFFGEDRDVATITPGDADDFKQFLVAEQLAPTTVHKRLQVARSWFRAMVRRKLIQENPFEGVQAAATGAGDRQRFITRKEIEAVLEACPDHDWRLIVALSRYGGLRCPSEVCSLTWGDVDWHRGRVCVTSPKTEHHPGRGERWIPLFPELRPHLEHSFNKASEGAVYAVAERFRKSSLGKAGWLNANLRTPFQKILHKAGISPWPKLFQNLRASRETELLERFPIQVVTSWLGNTPKVAMKHYLMTHDEHFAAALEGADLCSAPAGALQNPTSQTAKTPPSTHGNSRAVDRKPNPVVEPKHEKTPTFSSKTPGFAAGCDESAKVDSRAGMAGTGFDSIDATTSLRNDLRRSPLCSAAESDVTLADLGQVIADAGERCPDLPASILAKWLQTIDDLAAITTA